MIPRFLEVCPSFAPRWEAHLAYWAGDERGDFIDIAELAHFIVEAYEKKQTEPFVAIFAAAEEFLRSGHPKQKEVITIGLLEDLQTIASHRTFGADAFVRYLGPLSRSAWHEVARVWEGKSSLMDVVRAERIRANHSVDPTPGNAPRSSGSQSQD